MAGEFVMGFSPTGDLAQEALLPSVSQQALFRTLHYIFPITLFIYFVGISAFALCSLAGQKASKRKISRKSLVWSEVLVAVTYVAQASGYILRPLVEKSQDVSEDKIVNVLGSFIVWGSFVIALVDTERPVWFVYRTTWLLALAFEAVMIMETMNARFEPTMWDYITLGSQGVRVLLLVTMLGITIFSPMEKEEGKPAETQPLLAPAATQTPAEAGYGTVEVQEGSSTENEDEDSDSGESFDWYAIQDKAKKKMMKKIEEKGSWWLYAKEYMLFWPMIWPTKERGLQLRMFAVGICLLLTRVLNVLVPRQLGLVTDSLDHASISKPLVEVALYVFYRFLASGSGVSAVQDYLWLPIEQFSYKTITTVGYNHLMSLSHSFHTSKSNSDLYVTISQGRSITGIVETVCFKLGPMFVDLIVAVAYLDYLFGSYVALVVAAVTISYFYVTIKLGTAANAMRKSYNEAARKEVRYMWASVENWQTVNLFNRIGYEMDRYNSAIKDFVTTQRLYYLGVSVTGVAQSMIFTLGLLAASFIAVHQVTTGAKPVGDFVTLLSFWSQLSYPLHFFASFLRQIQSQMVDAERLLELLQTKPEVADTDTSKPLVLKDGEVEFEDVEFSYDKRKPTLKGISLRVPGGSTVALVGQSGGGKTTCLKLLFRFYDVKKGSIKIDGQDLRDVTVDSLRESVSVVPQDPELFDVSIMENIRYAKLDATDEEIYSVCKAAAIHDKISGFPDGYHSKVGPRGVKLSGGELQRIAIARALLKNTKIVLLDEATSMVDMNTEKLIQAAFKELANGRTMFIVAHRLSTIMRADKIVVIQDGQIAEQGSHDELFAAQGKYYDLWLQNSANIAGDDPKKGETTGDLLLDTNDAEVLAQFEVLKAKKTVDRSTSPPRSPIEASTSASKEAAFAFDKPAASRSDSDASVITVVSNNASRRSSILKPNAQPFIPPPHLVERLGSPSKELDSKPSSPTEPSPAASLKAPVFNMPNFGGNENAPANLAIRRLSNDGAIMTSSSDEASAQQPPHKRHRRRRNRRGNSRNSGNVSEGGSSATPSGASTPAMKLTLDTSSTAPPLPQLQISPSMMVGPTTPVGGLPPIIQLPRSIPVIMRKPDEDEKKVFPVPKKPLQSSENASSASSSLSTNGSVKKVVKFEDGSTPAAIVSVPVASAPAPTSIVSQPASLSSTPVTSTKPILQHPTPLSTQHAALQTSSTLTPNNSQPSTPTTQSQEASPSTPGPVRRDSGSGSYNSKRRWGSGSSGPTSGQGVQRPYYQKRRSSSGQQGGQQNGQDSRRGSASSQGGSERESKDIRTTTNTEAKSAPK